MSTFGARQSRTIAVIAPSFPPAFRGGGPARTLDALTGAASDSYLVKVFAPDRDTGEKEPLAVESNAWSRRNGVSVFYAAVGSVGGLRTLYAEVRRLRPDVIYLNSLFHLTLSIVPRLLIALGYWRGATILLAPRGELDSGALRIRGRKKRVFLALYHLLRLSKGVVWHASSAAEERAIRAVWGAGAVVLVRENETLLPTHASVPTAHEGPLRAVFISRLSPKKGLLTALEALHGVEIALEFDVYGPEEDERYVSDCRAAAAQVGANVKVRFQGPIPPERVRDALGRYDVMIFPTAGENFGHVIAESLSAACPVVTTDTTPWTALLRSGAGEVVGSQEVADWHDIFTRFAEMSPAERLHRRRAAAAGYLSWRAQTGGPHVFDLLAALVNEDSAPAV